MVWCGPMSMRDCVAGVGMSPVSLFERFAKFDVSEYAYASVSILVSASWSGVSDLRCFRSNVDVCVWGSLADFWWQLLLGACKAEPRALVLVNQICRRRGLCALVCMQPGAAADIHAHF